MVDFDTFLQERVRLTILIKDTAEAQEVHNIALSELKELDKRNPNHVLELHERGNNNNTEIDSGKDELFQQR